MIFMEVMFAYKTNFIVERLLLPLKIRRLGYVSFKSIPS